MMKTINDRKNDIRSGHVRHERNIEANNGEILYRNKHEKATTMKCKIRIFARRGDHTAKPQALFGQRRSHQRTGAFQLQKYRLFIVYSLMQE